MEHFPEVVLRETFSFLSVRDKLKLKCICKKWKFVLNTMEPQCSVCIYSTAYPYDERWCWSDERVAEEDLLYLKFDRENNRRFDLKKTFFANLRNVCLYRVGDKVDLFLAEMHLLSKLKVLMVDEVGFIKLRKLSSASLEKLSLDCEDFSDYFELDTPELSSVYLPVYQKVHFQFPLKVKHLRSYSFDSKLNRLKNLVTLNFSKVSSDFKLANFRSLSRLEVFTSDQRNLQVIRNIWEEKRRLGRDYLEMFVSGFRVGRSGILDLPILFGPSPEYLEYAARNHSSLMAQIPWTFYLFAHALIQCAHLIPPDFFDKFPRTYLFLMANLTITESEQSILAELIKRSKIRELKICNLNLPSKQAFYEKISSVRSINYLSIGPHLENVKFDHFLNLKHLQGLEIRFEKIGIRFVCKLFQKLKLLTRFNFYSTANKFQIRVHYETCPIEYLGIAPGVIADFSRPYHFSYNPPRGYHYVIRHCKDVDGLVREINRMREDEMIKDCIY